MQHFRMPVFSFEWKNKTTIIVVNNVKRELDEVRLEKRLFVLVVGLAWLGLAWLYSKCDNQQQFIESHHTMDIAKQFQKVKSCYLKQAAHTHTISVSNSNSNGSNHHIISTTKDRLLLI